MSSTLFEKICAGEIPADIVYQDDQCVCFRDIGPQAPTHLLLKLRGVRTGTGVILSGLPRIKKFPGASITIGNGVTIHSMARMNPVLSHHACLAALSHEARITLEDGCGVSGATASAIRVQLMASSFSIRSCGSTVCPRVNRNALEENRNAIRSCPVAARTEA